MRFQLRSSRLSGLVCVAMAGLCLAWNPPGRAATIPIYINNSPLVSPPAVAPQIDARAWLNRSIFDVTVQNAFGNPIPFESYNTVHFTNNSSGLMVGDPGFRFYYNTNGQRRWMENWVNQGTISTDHESLFSGLGGGIIIFFSDSQASTLQVSATNITSPGPLSSGTHGLVRLEGKKIDLTRSGIRTGAPLITNQFFFGGGFTGFSNYVNDLGVSDLYWATGTNNFMDNRGTPMRLDGLTFAPRFSLPFPSSPDHQVAYRSFFGTLFTNITRVPGFFSTGTNLIGNGSFLSGFNAVAHTTFISPTSSVIQVVFYPTNGADPDFTTDVRFASTGFGLEPSVVVGFHSMETDIVTETITRESVYLIDASANETNQFLARNLNTPTRRPNTIEITRFEPFEYRFGFAGNTPFDPALIYNPSYRFASVTNRYVAYAAQVDTASSIAVGSVGIDPTNMPGRVEIIGDEVNLEQTRIRAESSFVLKSSNLTSNRLARVSAPMVNFDARSLQPQLVITNLAAKTVRRLGGTLQAWSGTWRNVHEDAALGTTNTILFHVMVLDSQLESLRPTVVDRFAVRGTNLVLGDTLNIARAFKLEGESAHITGGLNLPSGIFLAATNMVNLRTFTNDGFITIVQEQHFGDDRPTPYWHYVNRGTNNAASHFIRSTNFVNSGRLGADQGVLILDALSASIAGPPVFFATNFSTNIFLTFSNITLITNTVVITNVVASGMPAELASLSDAQITARNLSLTNAYLNVGTLFLNVTNSLQDSGPGEISQVRVTGGFHASRLPATNNLLGTHFQSSLRSFQAALHTWPATNRGAVPEGFTNNMALGRLLFDGGNTNISFQFAGVGASNALYVDYIDLINGATNANAAFSIAANFTIYFANANVPVEKLDGAAGGRFRWVYEFAGPLSSTNMFYPSDGNTYTFNIARVLSRDLDSDNDGIVNAEDEEPICVSSCFPLTATLIEGAPRQVMLSWDALPYSTSYVEYKASMNAANWLTLTNHVQGEYGTSVQIYDRMSPGSQQRIYRLRVVPAY